MTFVKIIENDSFDFRVGKCVEIANCVSKKNFVPILQTLDVDDSIDPGWNFYSISSTAVFRGT